MLYAGRITKYLTELGHAKKQLQGRVACLASKLILTSVKSNYKCLILWDAVSYHTGLPL